MHPMGRQALFKRYSRGYSAGLACMSLRISVKPRQDMHMLERSASRFSTREQRCRSPLFGFGIQLSNSKNSRNSILGAGVLVRPGRIAVVRQIECHPFVLSGTWGWPYTMSGFHHGMNSVLENKKSEDRSGGASFRSVNDVPAD